MNPIPPVDTLHRRLAETIEWCRVNASPNDPKNSLRTPALQPANLSLIPDKYGSFDYNWQTAISSVEALPKIGGRDNKLLNYSEYALPDDKTTET